MREGRTGVRRVLSAVALLMPLTLLAAGCTGDPQDTLTHLGDVSSRETDLFMPVFWIAVAVFVLVEGALLYTVVRFRRRPEQTELPAQTHGSTPLELAWTIAPAILLAGISIFVVRDIVYLADTPENPLEVTVTAQQWWWGFEYRDEQLVTANDMVIPVGRPVRVTLESKDIIHSFWVPKLAGKMDVVPNHSNTMWFNAREPGRYSGQCAEFCALSHAKMKFEVVAVPEAEYQSWVQQQRALAAPPSGTLALQGQQIFFVGQPCIACHAVRGQTVEGRQAIGNTGPDLTHFASRRTFAGAWLENNEQNLRRWLDNPSSIKPGSKMPDYNLTDEQITQLIAYLQSLR